MYRENLGKYTDNGIYLQRIFMLDRQIYKLQNGIAEADLTKEKTMIVVAAFIDGVRVDSITVATETDIPAAKEELLRFYPEALIYKKL